jgi:hypothetical protein
MRWLLAIAVLWLALPSAQARRYSPVCIETGDVMRPTCMGKDIPHPAKIVSRIKSRVSVHKIQNSDIRSSSTVVPHPDGCPRVAFCGCGTAVRLLGSPVRSLWLARAWYRFPRSLPAPNTAGVRPHHVIALIRQVAGNMWLVFDPNSGHHLTRIHTVDISRYTIVQPSSDPMLPARHWRHRFGW